jgi:hypothetical protein
MLFKRKIDEGTMRQYYPAMFAEAPAAHTSDKYMYIPTHKLVNKLVENGFSVAGARQSSSKNRTHARHVVYMTPNEFDPLKTLKVNEEIPLLALTNSHDAGSSFRIDTSFYRLVCSNGLMMPTSQKNAAKIIHRKSMENDFIDAAYKVVAEFPEQVRQINEMKTIDLTRDEQFLLAESAKNLVFDEKTIEINKARSFSIESSLLKRRHWEDRDKTDLWTTFNAIQENVIKGGFRVMRENDKGERSFRKTRPVLALDRDAKLNRELMSLAQKFAELKAG